jgi:hypothetical protein
MWVSTPRRSNAPLLLIEGAESLLKSSPDSGGAAASAGGGYRKAIGKREAVAGISRRNPLKPAGQKTAERCGPLLGVGCELSAYF